MKTYKEVELKLSSFLTSAPDGVGWLTSRIGSFTLGKEPRFPLIFSLSWTVHED